MRQGIAFGPSGWQGRLDEDITEEKILLVADAVIRYLFELHPSPQRIKTAIGFDGRTRSRETASLLAKTLSEAGINVVLSSGIVTTPVLSFAVLSNDCTLGIMVTGGNLPHYYNGIEFKGPYGGPLTPAATAKIESLLAESVQNFARRSGISQKEIVTVDFLPGYIAHLELLVDFSTLQSFAENPKNNANVLIDSMGGAGQTIIEDILARCGWRAQTLFGTPENNFFDRRPESVPMNLGALMYNVKVINGQFGVATDGDGGRCGIVDENGKWLNTQDTTLVLIRHLHKHKSWGGRILKSPDTTDKMLQVAAEWKIPLLDLGMHHGMDELLNGKTLLGSIGQGGYCYGNHLPECDGVLTGLFFAEMIAKEMASLEEIKERIQRSFGAVHYRVFDKPYDVGTFHALMQAMRDSPPKGFTLLGKYQLDIGGADEAIDRLKVHWGDCRWMLIEALPLLSAVRVHVEGQSEADLSAILDVSEKCF